ncbi:MAG TPA: tripartite tricarboxylate transporter TctB family protein [Beijerinckiaceae bacterium]|nr:tripartite tricarboxylate transporter TctB family protein [Beijerinckiaceae bacterium]
MNVRVANEKEFWAGVLFVLIGVGALSQIPHYAIGAPTAMGPGFFPLIIGTVLVLLGLMAAVRGWRAAEPTRLDPWPLVPLFFVTLGVILFALLLERAGLAAAAFALVAASCYRRLWRRPFEVLAIYVVMLALCVTIFIYGIKIPVVVL